MKALGGLYPMPPSRAPIKDAHKEWWSLVNVIGGESRLMIKEKETAKLSVSISPFTMTRQRN
jgi:hypothetical protein